MVITRSQFKKINNIVYDLVLVNENNFLFSSYGIVELEKNNNCYIIKNIINLDNTKLYNILYDLENLKKYKLDEKYEEKDRYFKNREDTINYFLTSFETELSIKISDQNIILYNPLKIDICFTKKDYRMISIYNKYGYLCGINYNNTYFEELTLERYLNGFILYSYGQELLYFPDKDLIDFGFDII